MQVSHPEFFITVLKFTRMNERDYPVPSTPRAQRVAVYGNSVPRWRGQTFINLFSGGKPMTTVAVGIALAKNVVAVHGVCASGKPELVNPDVKRNKLFELIASVPPCLIGMEACSGRMHFCVNSHLALSRSRPISKLIGSIHFNIRFNVPANRVPANANWYNMTGV
jgi:hypothetical protein